MPILVLGVAFVINFFGHCVVAKWFPTDRAEAYGFGSMVPDFALMARSKLAKPATTDAAVADGIALHHRTDAAFHGLPVVLGLMRELGERLAAYGCARGPARATGHIGIELLLDGELASDTSNAQAYISALTTQSSVLRWDADDDVDGAAAMAQLHQRLIAFGVPYDLARTDSIVHRLQRMLHDRPRLAPSAQDLLAMQRAIDDLRQRCVVATPTVLRSLRAGLGLDT